jgi:hypothetical protein
MLNSTFFHGFLAAYNYSVLSFFPTRQVSEKIFNESSKSTAKHCKGVSCFPDLRQTRCARKIPTPVSEITLFTKETTYTLDFEKYFFMSFWSHSIRAFAVLLKIHLRFSQKPDVLAAKNL